MSEKSMTLLTQKEIDILLKFLNEKNDELSSKVLRQESIDKLIELLNEAMAAHEEVNPVNVSIEKQELECRVNETTNYLELFTLAAETGETVVITPSSFESSCIILDESQWGLCISPINFHKVATVFKLQYSDATMQMVCKRFAAINFGDENYNIPEVFLPNSLVLEK